MKDYRLYIFDFDMTLFDSMKGVKRCYRKAFQAVGFPFDERKCQVYIRESLDHTFERFSNVPCKRREFIAAFVRESESCMVKNTTIFPETESVIKALMLRGKRLCIASGTSEDRIKSILKEYGLCGAFEHVIGYERTLEPKPSPYCLNYLMSKYDIPKEDVCYVGDAMNDMLAAKNAGIDGIYIPRGNPDDAPCAFRIETLRDILV
ncbi:MAG: HAD family hydrolase [Candidatus Methanomethylophilaceae archaeon]|nr:HAD family hydrolase [Candidatus Methanomethylophilaceae archaeon]